MHFLCQRQKEIGPNIRNLFNPQILCSKNGDQSSGEYEVAFESRPKLQRSPKHE